MKSIIILSFVFLSTACTLEKKSYCDLVEEPILVEETLKKPNLKTVPK